MTGGTFSVGTFDGCPYLRSANPNDTFLACQTSSSSKDAGLSGGRSGEGTDGPLAEAYLALESGDLAQAASLLSQVALEGDAEAGENAEAIAFAAIPHLVRLAEEEEPAVLDDALAFLEAQAAKGQARRVLALRALHAAFSVLGDVEGALTAADALVALSNPEDAHFGAAHAARVQAIVATGELGFASMALLAAQAVVGEGNAELAAAAYDLAARIEAEEVGAGPDRIAPPASSPVAASLGSERPSAFAIGAPYPNPAGAGDGVTVPVDIHEAAEVSVEVYDVLGRRVASMRAALYAAGTHAVVLPSSVLAAGPYVARVQAVTESGAAHSGTKRFSVLR